MTAKKWSQVFVVLAAMNVLFLGLDVLENNVFWGFVNSGFALAFACYAYVNYKEIKK